MKAADSDIDDITTHLESIKLTGLKRDVIDKFYTNSETVDICISNIKEHLVISDNDLVIEPSAGSGSFIDALRELCKNTMFLDILPEDESIIKQDFLKYEPDVEKYDNIHVIGNPPFGRQSSMAIKFIKKSCLFCKSISFILPKSFKKQSMHKSFPKFWHLIFEIDLGKNIFLVDGNSYDVPCVFQIWEKKDEPREVPEKLTPVGFSFVSKNNNPDVSFWRVGGNAGNIEYEINSKSAQSHYFMQFDNKDLIDGAIKKLQQIGFAERENTSGPRSISKQELIAKLNVILAEEIVDDVA